MHDLDKEIGFTPIDPAKLSSINAGTLKDVIRFTGFAAGTITKLLKCHFETGNSILFIYESNFNN